MNAAMSSDLPLCEVQSVFPTAVADLPRLYHDLVTQSITRHGMNPQYVLSIDMNYKLTFHVLLSKSNRSLLSPAKGDTHIRYLDDPRDYTPDDIVRYAMSVARRPDTQGLIFGTDRIGWPSDGVTLDSLIAGIYWPGGSLTDSLGFVIEYQHEPREVMPTNWGNPVWNDKVKRNWKCHASSVPTPATGVSP